ncbi:MAG: pantetheine-phosphate adenylyltransferase [Dehalococcoidia bacterium]|nr:pantetheine-phosphate adenylyltransferase [Dehalococcoidia bacterium]MQG15977.1 pantetheine-phosphate adenylyltransferase [SAR202 cluster bacterium]|tara:strand:+ start:30851 stop:31333 length:483 start_codon:yes stop_codon:yes gene_type:complete
MVTAIYPGTFDPVHNGHVDVAGRASKLFDKLIIGVYDSSPKNLLFNTSERVEMFAESVVNKKNVEVVPFSGLAVDFAIKVNADFILRGLRAGIDFEVEFEMAHMWRNLFPNIDVVCVMSALEHQFIHSSRIKEVAQLGGNVEKLVPPGVAGLISEKLNRK